MLHRVPAAPAAAEQFFWNMSQVEEWMSQASGVPLEELRQYMFLYHDREATEHIMRVAGGLDSLVMGEGQILAQVGVSISVLVRMSICSAVLHSEQWRLTVRIAGHAARSALASC